MSRIGYQPIEVPKGVQVSIQGLDVSVKGPKGKLDRRFDDLVMIEREGDKVHVRPRGNDRRARAMHGLSRSLLNNMVVGVTEGFQKTLEVQGVGYKVAAEGKTLRFELGFSHSIEYPLPDNVDARVAGLKVTLTSNDKEAVGQVAANIRGLRPPEPYKGKGIRYSGEHVRRKEGKKVVG